MTRSRIRTGIAAIALSALGFVGTVATAGPASAASPVCNLREYVENNAWIPIYSDGHWTTRNCVMSQNRAGYTATLQLQQSMNLCFRSGIAEDGDFGPQTRDALKQVQRHFRITADGIYGPQTRRTMYHESWWQGNPSIQDCQRVA